jgi:uncharacterized protein (TIGR03437 family)
MKYLLSGSVAMLLCALLLSIYCLTVVAQQPNWMVTGNLNQARYNHTATLLANGKVLLAGGFIRCGDFSPPCPLLDSAELYDPATGRWELTGRMSMARAFHIAIRLNNGKVLVAGGVSGTPLDSEAGAELYDPATGAWTVTGSLNVARRGARAVLLANGKVLIAGGVITVNGLPRALDTAEVYDPAIGGWSLTGVMNSPRVNHSLTLLPNGQVLAAGGWGNDLQLRDLILVRSAELYDPVSGRWSATSNLSLARARHAATLLANGKVLVASGITEVGVTLMTELYDPASGLWSATGNPSKYRETALLLPNGKVLALGADGEGLSTELYDPASGTWSAHARSGTRRNDYTATLLPSGKVLVAGGNRLEPTQGGRTFNLIGLNSAELYDPATPLGTLASLSAASYRAEVASEAIVAAFGANLAASTVAATTLPLPTMLAGVTVRVTDSSGIERNAPLFFVSPRQINYQIPFGTASGAASVTVLANGAALAAGAVQVTTVAPGLFSANANGQGVAAAVVLRIKPGSAQSFEPVARFDAAQNRFVAAPIELGPETDQVFLLLFGTGLRRRSSLTSVTAMIGGLNTLVEYAGPQGDFAGLDQVNLRLPRALAGRGEVNIALMADGKAANVVTVSVR